MGTSTGKGKIDYLDDMAAILNRKVLWGVQGASLQVHVHQTTVLEEMN